ncbi:hypothetical protein F2P79_006440 [Pimephales promelas]|nr:hypothetical protein F2P79_006440 [Pimephales promelas]
MNENCQLTLSLHRILHQGGSSDIQTLQSSLHDDNLHRVKRDEWPQMQRQGMNELSPGTLSFCSGWQVSPSTTAPASDDARGLCL